VVLEEKRNVAVKGVIDLAVVGAAMSKRVWAHWGPVRAQNGKRCTRLQGTGLGVGGKQHIVDRYV